MSTAVTTVSGITILIEDTGEITYPFQSAFLAYLGSTVSDVTGAGTTWQLGTTTALTEVFDRNNDFNTNGTFTAPVTGLYHLMMTMEVNGFSALMTTGNATIITTARSYQGGHVNPFAAVATSGSYDFGFTVLVDMTAGDTATFHITISGGAGDTADVVGSGSPYSTFVCGWLVA